MFSKVGSPFADYIPMFSSLDNRHCCYLHALLQEDMDVNLPYRLSPIVVW